MRELKSVHELATLPLKVVQVKTKLPTKRGRNEMRNLCIVLPICALLLWLFSLRGMNIRNMSDLGLISIFSPLTIFALIIMMVSFCLALRQSRLSVPIIILHFGLLIFMLYGIENLIEEASRFAVVYRHAGYVEYIMRTGSVDTNLDAYFSWPGFFVLSALVTKAAGYHDILAYARWAPVFFNVIYFGPLYMIFTSSTTDKRLIWLAMWFFYLTNWIEQDYFSPQGLNFFLYLVIFAILLKWFKAPSLNFNKGINRLLYLRYVPLFLRKTILWFIAPDELYESEKLRQRWALFAILLLIFSMVIFSHPLTPFFVLASSITLAIFRRYIPRWLPVIFGLMTVAWLLFMTHTFFVGHASMIVGNIGKVNNAITTNVTTRVVQGNVQHTFIATMRVVMTVIIAGLAFIGGIRRYRQGHRDITSILLALAPFSLIVAQQYGGEMFLRIYLFSLPSMVFLAASLFYPSHFLSIRGISIIRTSAILLTCLVLLGGFFFTRYGNENMDYMTYAEVDGVQHLYKIAPPNSLLLELWNGAPWQSQDFEKYRYISMYDISQDIVSRKDVPGIINFIKRQNLPHTYLIITRSEEVQSYSLGGIPRGTLHELENALLKTGKFKMVYSNHDVQILTFLG